MPPNPDRETIQEIYRLARENNRMLHAMRRNAFLGSILRIALYLAFLLGAGWLYLHYVAPLMEQLLKTLQQVQGTGSQAQSQLQGAIDALKKLQSLVPGSSVK